MGDLSEHFSRSEFKCRCCSYGMHDGDVSPELIEVLEHLRDRLGGKPIHINSGCRCIKHNRKVGGVRNSQHLRGTAADILVHGVSPDEVQTAAMEIKAAGGIGRYDTFTHVDVRGHRATWGPRA
jgi:uncharacterized protein YcbK (DUF882 family)